MAARVIPGLAAAGGAAAVTAATVLWAHALQQVLGGAAPVVAAGVFACAAALGGLAASAAARGGGRARWALVALQAAGAAWALASPRVGLAAAAGLLASATAEGGAPLARAYAIAAVALAVPGLLAGATVPLAADLAAAARPWPWAAAGAAAGGLTAGLWVLPAHGCEAGFGAVAALHALVAALVALGARARAGAAAGPEPPAATGASWRMAAIHLAAAGLCAVGWQALGTRLVSLAIPPSPAWPAIAIACWAGGAGAGAALVDHLAGRGRAPRAAPGAAQVAGAAAALLGAALAAWAAEQLAAARPLGSPALAELAICAAAVVPAAMAIGALVRATAGAVGSRGLAVAALAAGGALGTVAAPLLLLPALGLSHALLALGAAQAAVGLWPLVARGGRARSKARERARPQVCTAAALVGLLVAAGLVNRADLRPWSPELGAREPERVIWGAQAAVVTAHDRTGSLRLWVDRRQGLGGDLGEGFIERRLGHLPLLLHGRARSVLALGVGTGNTLGAVTLHAGPGRIEAAEGLGPVLGMLDLFSATNEQLWRDGRVRLHNADAQVVLARARPRFDVIVAGPVHPWQAGWRGLVELDALRLARARLEPGGLVCLWLPLDELGAGDLAVVSATFLRAFGGGTALLGHLGWRQPVLGLVAGGPREALTRDRLGQVLGSSPPAWAVETDLAQPEDVQALYVGGTAWLRAMAGRAPASTWAHPVLEPRTAATWWRGAAGLGERALARVMARRRPVAEVAPGDERAARRHRAVAVLIEGELAEAAGDLEGAVRGYVAAAEIDPTFELPGVALSMLRGRLRREGE